MSARRRTKEGRWRHIRTMAVIIGAVAGVVAGSASVILDIAFTPVMIVAAAGTGAVIGALVAGREDAEGRESMD